MMKERTDKEMGTKRCRFTYILAERVLTSPEVDKYTEYSEPEDNEQEMQELITEIYLFVLRAIRQLYTLELDDEHFIRVDVERYVKDWAREFRPKWLK